MGKIVVELDCTKDGPIGANLSEEPIEKVKPYLHRLDFDGKEDSLSISADDPVEANFKVINMTDIQLTPVPGDEKHFKLLFKATVEFNLDFEPDDEYGGKFFKKVIDETDWTTTVSSNIIGLEKSDGTKDNEFFDGLYDSIKIKLNIL